MNLTEQQKQLIEYLDQVLMMLSEECENDLGFDEHLAELNIFSRDIVEISFELSGIYNP